MKSIKSYVVLSCCAIAVLTLCANNKSCNEASSYSEASIATTPSFLDTRNKSADGQFETSIGTFTEIPKFNDNNEKIKNILYSNSSSTDIKQEDLDEIKDIVFDSGYNYDEVLINVSDEYCIKYNPFTNKEVVGRLDTGFNFIETTEY